ncbi:MAG: hypothetical protein O2867_09040, partial [Bacteroidetes bacterium]|nr:hypothetical protein [Bacteroidota bacterium]
IYTDERSKNESRNNFRFEIDSLQSHYGDFTVHSAEGLVTTGPENGDRLDIRAVISGPASGISSMLKNDHFFFEEGEIWLNADIHGAVTDASEIIRLSDAQVKMTSPVVYYKPADVRFSLDEIDLVKKGPNADVVISGTALNPEHSFIISGGINNLDAVIEGREDGNVRSTVKVSSECLSWKDVVDLFGQESSPAEGPIRDERLKKKSMKQTLEGIQSHFNPNLTIAIDTFIYRQGLEFIDFKTGLFFQNMHELNLKQTQFTLDGAPVEFNGSIDIKDALKTSFSYTLDAQHLNLENLLPKMDYFQLDLLKDIEELPKDVDLYIEQVGLIDDVLGLIPNSSAGIIRFRSNGAKDFSGQVDFQPDDPIDLDYPSTKVRLEGEPDLFNEFFQNEEFFFEGGQFEASLAYGGTVKDVVSLVNRANIQLELKDSEVFYKSVGVRFPIRAIGLDMLKDTADFSILLSSGAIGQSLSVQGHAESMSEVIFGAGGKDFNTNAKIYSPHIVWPQLNELINSVGASLPDTTVIAPTLKETVRGVMRTFEPDLLVIIDTLEYSKDFILHNVYSGLSMDEKDLLTLDRTGFEFNAGSVGLKATMDLSTEEETPFTVDLNTERLDMGALMDDLDYFSIKSLQSTEELKGKLTMQLNFSGAINAKGDHLVIEENKGLLSFQLEGLEIQGMPMIDTLAEKIRLSKRMDRLLFAPLTNTLIMEGDLIHVPLMEVQSNALNLFLEGELSTGNRTNLWVTVPLDNLSKRDLTAIPTKRGYENSGEKVHIELMNASTGVFKTKLHTSRRKFYKQRVIKPRFKEDKQFFRNLRRNTPKD